jgi:enterochelin esterase family protein
MIFQDAPNYYNVIRTPQIMDTLIAAGEMPVAIAVFIEPGQQRSEEYDSRNEKYGDFLLTEFLPNVVLNNFDIVDDPNGWLIGGHSSGGCCAFNAAWFNPDRFHKVVTHSGSFVGIQDDAPMSDYIDIVASEAPKPLRVSLHSGTNDLGGGAWFEANNDMAASLMQAGYHHRYIHSTSSHDLSPFATSGFPDVLRWMWRGYSLPHYEVVP